MRVHTFAAVATTLSLLILAACDSGGGLRTEVPGAGESNDGTGDGGSGDGRSDTVTPLLDKWQRFVDGNPTLELSERQSLALHNRNTGRSTHSLYGAQYGAGAEGRRRELGLDLELYERDSHDNELVTSLPDSVTFESVLEHNDVKVFKLGINETHLEDGTEELYTQEGLFGYLEFSVFSVHREVECEGSGASCDGRPFGNSYIYSESYGHFPGSSPSGLGSATWTGIMTGLDVAQSPPSGERWVLGEAMIDIDDLSNPDVDVSFTDIRELATGASRSNMVWDNLSLTIGAFSDESPHTINGLFYGPSVQEVGGVFDRDGITGAFGGAVSEGQVVPVETPTSSPASHATASAIESVVDVSDGHTNIGTITIASSGSGHKMVVQTAPFRYAQAVPYRNDVNALEFQTSHSSTAVPADPLVGWQGRSIWTSETVVDHSLGDLWEVFQGEKEYTNGAVFTVYLATDAEISDTLDEPWVGYGETDRAIALSDIPDLLAGHDWQGVLVPEGGLQGTLDGTPGTFTCDSGSGCYLEFDRQAGYYPGGGNVMFIPNDPDRNKETLPSVTSSAAVTTADYLSMGYWLYLPDGSTSVDLAEFGVLAGGGDPFEPSHLQRLIGTATYAGKAIGMHYIGGSSNDTSVGSFEADVELMADFGTSIDDGTLQGRIFDFITASGSEFIPTELRLEEASVFADTYVSGSVFSDDSDATWRGEWGAAFFGNGSATGEHPTGVAGTFGAINGDSGMAGSFGAQRQ